MHVNWLELCHTWTSVQPCCPIALLLPINFQVGIKYILLCRCVSPSTCGYVHIGHAPILPKRDLVSQTHVKCALPQCTGIYCLQTYGCICLYLLFKLSVKGHISSFLPFKVVNWNQIVLFSSLHVSYPKPQPCVTLILTTYAAITEKFLLHEWQKESWMNIVHL